jgi:hypothetical protein
MDEAIGHHADAALFEDDRLVAAVVDELVRQTG